MIVCLSKRRHAGLRPRESFLGCVPVRRVTGDIPRIFRRVLLSAQKVVVPAHRFEMAIRPKNQYAGAKSAFKRSGGVARWTKRNARPALVASLVAIFPNLMQKTRQ